MITATNKKSNPGAFTARKLPTIRKLAKNSLKFLKKGDVKTLAYYLISHFLNYFQLINFWRGNKKFYCPCCESNLKFFIHLSNHTGITWNSSCPNCDSRSRHRALSRIMSNFFDSNQKKLFLHFAPEPVLMKIFKENPNLVYKSTDLFLQDVDYPNEDITALSFKDNTIDIILCNHVLEHIANDDQACKEIYRILKNNGKAILTIPGNFSAYHTKIFEKPDDNGHYRHYGLDVKEKFKKVFETVECIDMTYLNHEQPDISLGIKKYETVFLCTKLLKNEAN